MNGEKNKTLHSRYNPQSEAERFIDSLSLDEKTGFFILIEPGLGYIAAPLKKKAGGAKIIALHAERHDGVPPPGCIDAEWFPEEGKTVQDFLEAEMPDSENEKIQIVEWRPALPVYGQVYLNLVEEAVHFIKLKSANARTLKAFGHRWFRNFFINLALMENAILPPITALPVLVTGAGPSLEETISRIKSGRDSVFILAASSSVEVLAAEGLLPDMVISTDGSGWAKYHLYGFFREKLSCPLAVSLSAALPSQIKAAPILAIADGSLWQTLILRELGLPFVSLPQRGTVSATALDLAFMLTKGSVFISGMDLANRDLLSHSRPYSFDRFMEEKAGRLNPFYSQSFVRSSMLKEGGSFEVYASWFRKQLASYPERLFSLGNNNPLFNSVEGQFPPKTAIKNSQNKNIFKNHKMPETKNDDGLSVKALSVLEKAFDRQDISSLLRKELVSLLFAGRKDVTQNELIETMRSLAALRKKR